MSAPVTFAWTYMHPDMDGKLYEQQDELGMEIGLSLTAGSCEWYRIVAANLALASLLCRAADGGYENRWRYSQSTKWVTGGSPYPERAP